MLLCFTRSHSHLATHPNTDSPCLYSTRLMWGVSWPCTPVSSCPPAGTYHIQNLIFCCRPGCGLSTHARRWALDAVTITTQTRMQLLAWRLGASGQEKSPLPDMFLPCGTHTSEFTIKHKQHGPHKGPDVIGVSTEPVVSRSHAVMGLHC